MVLNILQFNLAVGGNWPGNPDETTDFENAELKVDYVKVYQLDSYDENVTKPEKEPVDLREMCIRDRLKLLSLRQKMSFMIIYAIT